MKKKLTAVLLTLCLVLGLLPMSALAVWTTDDGAEVEITDGKVTIDGTEYTVLAPVADPQDGDTVDYYSFYNNQYTKVGTLTWKADAEVVVNVTATVGADGVASAEVTSNAIDQAIKNAASVDDLASADAVKIAVTVDESATGLKVTLPAEAASKLAEANVAVNVTSDVGGVELPAEVVSDFTGAVELTMAPTEITGAAEGSDAAKLAAAEGSVALDLSLTVGGTAVSTFARNVTVSVKATLTASSANPIIVYYVDGDNITVVASVSELTGGMLSWPTGHFSTWAYMNRDKAEEAGLSVVVPEPTPNVPVEAFPTITNEGLGKAYTFTAAASDSVIYQVVGADGAVKSLVLTSGGTSYKVSAKDGENVLAYVGTGFALSADKTHFTYDSISAAYDSAKTAG